MSTHKKLRRAAAATAVAAGLALAGTGLYPALASEGSPELPDVTAEELLVKVAEAEEQQLTGAVRVDAGLNVPGADRIAEQFGGPAAKLAGLATGKSTLRIAVDGPENQRLAISDGSEEFSVIHKGEDLWMYDETDNVVYYATVHPEAQAELEEGFDQSGLDTATGLTPQEAVQQVLDRAGEYADISVDGTSRVAGQDAYDLLIETKDDIAGGADRARVSIDAETGVPLSVTVFDGDQQKLDVAFSKISYEPPAGANFDFTPPQDAEVIELDQARGAQDLVAGLLTH